MNDETLTVDEQHDTEPAGATPSADAVSETEAAADEELARVSVERVGEESPSEG